MIPILRRLGTLDLRDPWFLLFALPACLAVAYAISRLVSGTHLLVSDTSQVTAAMGRRRGLRAYLPATLRLLALLLLLTAAARPRFGTSYREIMTEGIDIVMTLDISSSMLCEDFRPKNRLFVAKKALKDFVKGRQADRIGLVVFAGKAFTKSPLTLDYDLLLRSVDQVDAGEVEDGTAIGLGLATAINRLRSAKGKSKVIVLLTDGNNNRFEIDPRTAANLAKSLGIKVYCIGAGTKGEVSCPMKDPRFGTRYLRQRVDLDEDLLTEVAKITGGLFFRATDSKSLEAIYRRIGRLEKSKVKVKEYKSYEEVFMPLLMAGLVVWLFAGVLANSLSRVLP